MSTKKQNVVIKTSKSKEIKSSTRETSKEEIATKNVPTSVPQIKTEKSKPTTTSQSKTTTIKKNVAKRTPSTPPSSRVTKSQFFPSKTMYAAAIKNTEPKNNPTTSQTIKTKKVESKQTNPLLATNKPKIRRPLKAPDIIQSPDSHSSLERPIIKKPHVPRIKKQPKVPETDSPSSLDRPRTATLRKGSIVNQNIVGPEAPQPTPPVDDYEDDFDSYASDFDEYESSVSSSSISSLPSKTSSTTDSENTPIKTRPSDEEKKLDSGNFELHEVKHVPILENITENTAKLSSLSDEGFEDAKSLQFINFMGAKQKQQREKSQKKRRKRGEELLSMIRLNNQYFELFELSPVAYDDFIKIYGRSNSYQVSTQTGDDNLQEETQTDYIEVKNKWSQFPAVFDKVECGDGVKNVKIETGSDEVMTECKDLYNEYNLVKFMNTTGRFVDEFLYETSKFRYNSCDNQIDELNQITDGFCKLEANILEGRKVACINFSGNKLITFHEPNGNVEFLSKSIGCVWNLKDLQIAEFLVSTYGLVTCACVDFNDDEILFAGSRDGSVSVWEISRTSDHNFYGSYCTIDDTRVIPTSFVTDVDLKSSCEIVSISSYFDDTLESTTNHVLSLSKVLTLHENGIINNWSLIKKDKNVHITSQFCLVKTRTISLRERHPDLTNLFCTKMTLNPRNLNHLYIATNYGLTLHCPETNGRKNTRHSSNIESSGAVVNIEVNPHFSEFFLSTHSNGNTCLFKRHKSNPLITIMNKNEEAMINRIVHWSPFRPCIFYTADNHDVLHVWDLTYSEFYPSLSVPYKKGIKLLEIQPREAEDDDVKIGYMALVNNEHKIEMHVLNKKHGPSLPEDYKMECKQFSNYVKRL